MKSHASMNRIYRLIFNATTCVWVAVAETARGRCKTGHASATLPAPIANARLRPLHLALLACGFLLLAPAHAGPPNAVPVAPAPVTPGNTQYPALNAAAGCGGQYSKAISDTTIAGLATQTAGVITQGVALGADIAGLIAESLGAATLISAAAVPGIIAQSVAVAANIVGITAAAAGLGTQTAAQVLTVEAAKLPQCDTTFAGTVQVNTGGTIVTGNSHFNNSVGVVTDVNVGGKVQATRLVATDNTTTDTLTATGLSTTNGVSNTGNIATTTLGVSGLITTTTLSVSGLSTTNGISNTGNIATNTLSASSLSTTNGIANTGNIATTTLGVSGLSTTNGIANTGNIATTTLNATGLSTTNGITNTGNIASTTLSTTAGVTIGSTLNVGTNAVVGGNMSVANGLTVSNNVSLGGANNAISSGPQSLVVDAASARLVSGGNRIAVSATGVEVSGTGAKVTLSGPNVSLLNATNHGLTVTANQTLISGGTSTTNLVLNDSGATFSDNRTGGPAKVTGIADGTTMFDAVNFRQLQAQNRQLSTGIASTTAIANIPPLDYGKTFAVGVGVGVFNGATALAIGGNYRMSPNVTMRGSMGLGSRSTNAIGAGASISW